MGGHTAVCDSPMAQSVARQAVNLQVAGSNPAGGGFAAWVGAGFRSLVDARQPAWRNGSASVSGAGGCGFDPHRGCVFVWCATARPAAQRVL